MGLQKMKQNLKNNHKLVKPGGGSGGSEVASSPLGQLNSQFAGRTPYYPTTTTTTVRLSSVVDSKSSNMLFTTIKTTKMKRTKPTNANNIASSNLCMACSNNLEACNTNANNANDLTEFNVKSGSNKTTKTLKSVSLKAIGISIANILKPTVSWFNN